MAATLNPPLLSRRNQPFYVNATEEDDQYIKVPFNFGAGTKASDFMFGDEWGYAIVDVKNEQNQNIYQKTVDDTSLSDEIYILAATDYINQIIYIPVYSQGFNNNSSPILSGQTLIALNSSVTINIQENVYQSIGVFLLPNDNVEFNLNGKKGGPILADAITNLFNAATERADTTTYSMCMKKPIITIPPEQFTRESFNILWDLSSRERLWSIDFYLKANDKTFFSQSISLIDLIQDNDSTGTYAIDLSAFNFDSVWEEEGIDTTTTINFKLEYRIETLYDYIQNGSIIKAFQYSTSTTQPSSIDLFKVIPDPDNGRMILYCPAMNGFNNCKLYRTSSDSNEQILLRDNLNISTMNDCFLDDKFIKSGVFYKYSIFNKGIYYPFIFFHKPSIEEEPWKSEDNISIMTIFDDDFLTGANGMQFNIKFDRSVNSMKRVLSEAKIEAIGAQYPFIRRNSKVKYYQFPISGLISCLEDPDNLMKASKKDLYGSTITSLQERQNQVNSVNPHNDYTYERDFRKKIEDFLCDGQPKVFRSSTEGNILVYLMDVNLTPNKTLGRLVYNFSATAYEIGEMNGDNLLKHKLINPISSYNEITMNVSDFTTRYETESNKWIKALDAIHQDKNWYDNSVQSHTERL